MQLSLFHEFPTKRDVFVVGTHVPLRGDSWKMTIASLNFLSHCQRQEGKCGENGNKLPHPRRDLAQSPVKSLNFHW